MSSSTESDSRAARGLLRRRFFVTAALFVAIAAHAAPADAAAARNAQAGGRSLITSAAGVRLRESPDAASAEVGRLQLGIVVQELERSAARARVGSAEDFWHLVSAPGGARGWVFGGLVAPFDPARRDEIYVRLASERVANAAATFAELTELVRFLERATKEVRRREALAELELTRLVALARSLANFSIEEQEKPPYKPWVTEHEREIVYSEPAGQWYVRADLFWELEKKYRGLPVAERAAWQGAQTPLPGECEGYLPCHLYVEKISNAEYLKRYPRGAHSDAALANIAELLGHVTQGMRGADPVFHVPSADRAEFRKTVAELRANLAQVPAGKKARVLGQLDAISRRFR